MEQKYYEAIKEKIVNKELCESKGSNLKIVYTPIHGTGLVPCTEILKQCGFENTIVPEEQALPDETFPTVTSPNPENPEALSLAIGLMKQQDVEKATRSIMD